MNKDRQRVYQSLGRNRLREFGCVFFNFINKFGSSFP